ncbi:MAG: asparagine synthase (glutamine-hydrolyzing) [Desulfobacteraceae bacterium]|nr:MAG: asparagine synthase (glutamine-hydrolyzing) [Desulfobacteraceae bacterium]
MCGIVGYYSPDNYPFLKESLSQATECLRHRGPDDAGLFNDPEHGVGLGHRRLSIIDLSKAGHQPMQSEDGQVIIVYNGEVYNFVALRKELQKRGYRFKSASDTEVILKAYLEWGDDCLQEFIGMFAIAIWDRRKRHFFLARDRLGIKPVYYYYDEQTFLFASELKALMALNGFKHEINHSMLPLFLHYQYIPAPHTIFKNTYKLLPGQQLIFDGKHINPQTYWRLPQLGETNVSDRFKSEDYCLDKLDVLLTQAVSDRLVSDVPLGALLSGGIDSSIVVALMQKVNPNPVRTFSIGFKEKTYNEAPWAKQIAQQLGTDHTELYVTPQEALEAIPQIPKIYDEPFADSSAIPTFLISRLTRSQVTVALSGDGGDEQFAGYVRYWMTQTMVNWVNALPQAIKKLVATLLANIPMRLIEGTYQLVLPSLPQRLSVANFHDKWQKLIDQLYQSELSELYRMTICIWPETDIMRLTGGKLLASQFEKSFARTANWPVLSRLMHVDQTTYLPDAMLTKVDRASMAASLEVRVPLLDHRVIEFTAQIPEVFKYRNGQGKYILKKLLSKYVPPSLYERPKMGFGVPLDHWFRTELKDLLTDYLSTDRLKREGILNHTVVEEKVKEHLTGRLNHQYRLWSLLIWEMWRERWLGG